MSSDVPRETSVQKMLKAYRKLLLKWNKRIPLVSRKNPEEAFDRLCTQSVEAEKNLPYNIQSLIDIGSGGGLPGIPLAILRPEMQVKLIERSKNKCLFLRAAAIHLELDNLEIINESWNPDHLDQPRPLVIMSLGVGEYEALAKAIWPQLRSDDGLLLFISRKVAEGIAKDVSCETLQWHKLEKSAKTGIAWIAKN